MDHRQQEEVALHRWAVIAEATSDRLTPAERGALVRQIAARAHTHPDGSARRYSRGTIDRWIRAWRAGGLEALRPSPRADTGTVRAHPELFAEAAALRLELPARSAAQIASILFHRHGVRVAERTIRAQLRRAGCTAKRWPPSRRCSAAMRRPARTSGGSPTCWSAHGSRSRDRRLGARPAVPHRRRPLPAAGRRPVLRPRERPGLPGAAAPGHHAPRRARRPLCRQRRAVLQRLAGPHLRGAGHPPGPLPALLARRARQAGAAQPLHPRGVPGRGDPSRHRSRSRSSTTCSSPGPSRWPTAGCTPRPTRRRSNASSGGPHRQVDPERLREAFRWSVTRKVTRTATVPLEGNTYAVDPALVGRRVELRYDPEDLSRIDVFLDGTRPGWPRRSSSAPHPPGRPPGRPAQQAPTGIDYLGLVAAAHDEAAGTGAKIDFSQLAMFTASDGEQEKEQPDEPGAVGRPLRPRPHPLRQVDRRQGPVHPPGPRKKPSPASTSASSSPPSAWSPVTSARERRCRCEPPSPPSTRPATRSSTSPTRPLAPGGSMSPSSAPSAPSRAT